MPPFSLQSLVENAVQHGLHSSPQAGRLQLAVGVTGQWLEISVSDDGQGVPSTGVEQLFFAERPRVHALALLRRRLQGLFGRSFQLEVRSEIGEGTTITMRTPLQTRFEVIGRSQETMVPDTDQVGLTRIRADFEAERTQVIPDAEVSTLGTGSREKLNF